MNNDAKYIKGHEKRCKIYKKDMRNDAKYI